METGEAEQFIEAQAGIGEGAGKQEHMVGRSQER